MSQKNVVNKVSETNRLVTKLINNQCNTSISNDPQVAYAEQLILDNYGDVASVAKKGKSLIKFGRNATLDTTEETVWLIGGLETYKTANSIDSIVSDNAADTQDVIIEGHTIDGSGNLTFVVQSVTLNGTTDVLLTTPLARANRLYNDDSTDFAGTIRVFDSVAVTDHLSTNGTNNQSLKCATSISQNEYWIITGFTAAVNRQNNRSVDFSLQVREKGKVFRTRYTMSVDNNAGTVHVPFLQPLIVPPNSDIRVNATSSGSATQVESALHGYLAVIV